MVTPNALAGQQFYKVGNWVTFAWNYTSLSVTPSAIDVLASCTANQATYTIAVNMSAEQTKVLWDTANTPDGQAPFLTEQYTLMIYDADLSVTAAPQAGYLGAYTGFTFGMYTPQPYTPWSSEYPPRHFVRPAPLTFPRLHMCKLQWRPFPVRKNDHQSPSHDNRNNLRLAPLLHLRLRLVVSLAT